MKLMKTFFALLTVLALSVQAADAPASRSFLCCDHNGGTVSIVAADGTIEWRVEAPAPQDCWRLPDGNILFCHRNGAKIVTKDKKVVWEYKAPPKTECHACQPLPAGHVMVVECGTSRICEVDEKGEIAHEIVLHTTTKAVHEQFRGARKLPNG